MTPVLVDDGKVGKLRQIAETRKAPYAATRDAARECLQ